MKFERDQWNMIEINIWISHTGWNAFMAKKRASVHPSV
jgi:hypothetical protein